MSVVLTEPEFARFRVLLAEAAGLVFDTNRRDSLGYSIAERLRRTGLPDVPSYLAVLDDPSERQALLDEVTIQETHFFRNPPQIGALRQHVLPELVRQAEARGTRRLRLWSAGCSTGEEAYSLAMLVRELVPTGWDVSILATDLSQRALATARLGHYNQRAVQLVTPDELTRFFQPSGSGWQVRDEVRDVVTFTHHNLVNDPVPQPRGDALDLVLCRNVTIYFARPTTRALMGRLHAGLRDGGWLFLGHSETLWQVSEEFRLVTLGSGDGSAFVYRRLDDLAERRAVLPDRRTAPAVTVHPERRVEARRAPRSFDVPDPLLLALEALSAGRYEQAAALAGQAATLEPSNAAAHYVRGRALVEAARDDEAVVALRKAVFLDPGRGFAHFLLASVLDRAGDRAAATREYAAAAGTLGTRPEDATSPELGGRSVAELAALCRQLQHDGRTP